MSSYTAQRSGEESAQARRTLVLGTAVIYTYMQRPFPPPYGYGLCCCCY